MKADPQFMVKLDAVVRNTTGEARAQVQELVRTVVDAGGVSEEALVGILRDPTRSTALRIDVCWLVPRVGIAAAAEVLKSLLFDPSEAVRGEAALGVGLVAPDGGVEALLRVLHNDRAKAIRLAALHALGLLSSPQSVDVLLAVIKDQDEDAEVRADAAEALAHVKDQRIVDMLIEALGDRSPLVRYSASYALGQQGDAGALPALQAIAAHDTASTPWGDVSSSAAEAIEAIKAHDGQDRDGTTED